MNILLAIIIGYLLGNINASYLLGKLFKGIDIREKGTANAGASNAVIVMGSELGVACGQPVCLRSSVVRLSPRRETGWHLRLDRCR